MKHNVTTVFTVRRKTVIADSEVLAAALLRLPEKLREVLLLRFCLAYNDAEIGRMFGALQEYNYPQKTYGAASTAKGSGGGEE